MPISSYPRPGHPIAPRLLRPFLNGRINRLEVKLCDLNRDVWERFDPETCHKLGKQVVAEIAAKAFGIRSKIGTRKIPALPPDMRFGDLFLERRTHNVLVRRSPERRLRGRSRMQIGELLKIRSFGSKSLVDLLTSLEAAAGPRICRTPHDTVITPELFEKVLRNEISRRRLLHYRLPTLPDDLTIQDLGLRQGTFNALARTPYVKDIASLGRLSILEMSKFRGFGTTYQSDLVKCLHRVALEPGSPSLIPRDLGRIVRRHGDVPRSLLGRCLPWPGSNDFLQELGLGPRKFEILSRAMDGGKLESLAPLTVGEILAIKGIGPTSLVEIVERLYAAIDRSQAESRSFEEVFLSILAPNGDQRTISMARAHLGLGNQDAQSFATIGKQYGISRARVGQICTPNLAQASPRILKSLERSFGHIDDQAPGSAAEIESKLVAEGSLEPGTRLESVSIVAKQLGFDPQWKVVGKAEHRFLVPSARLKEFRLIQGLARSRSAFVGPVHPEEVRRRASRVLGYEPASDFVVWSIGTCKDVRWLKEPAGWFWITANQGGRLGRLIRQVLCGAGRIRLWELHKIVGRCWNHPWRAPIGILREFCRLLPGCRLDGNEVVAIETFDPNDCYAPIEAKVVEMLHKYGPVCEYRRLMSLASRHGVRQNTLHHHLDKLPVIRRFAPHLYCLVGTQPVSDDIDLALSRSSRRP